MKLAPRALVAYAFIAGAGLLLFQNCGPAQLNSDTVVASDTGALDQGSSGDDPANPVPVPQPSPTPVAQIPSPTPNPAPSSTPNPTPSPVATPSVPAPVVSLSATSLDFGNVSFGFSSRRTVTVNNTGNATLTFSSIRITQMGFDFGILNEIGACRTSLAPGANCKVSVDFFPDGFGTVVATLNISTNAQSAAFTIPLSGRSSF